MGGLSGTHIKLALASLLGADVRGCDERLECGSLGRQQLVGTHRHSDDLIGDLIGDLITSCRLHLCRRRLQHLCRRLHLCRFVHPPQLLDMGAQRRQEHLAVLVDSHAAATKAPARAQLLRAGGHAPHDLAQRAVLRDLVGFELEFDSLVTLCLVERVEGRLFALEQVVRVFRHGPHAEEGERVQRLLC